MGFTEILEFWHFWVLLQIDHSAEYSAGASTYKTNKLFEAARKKTDKLPSLWYIFKQCRKNLIKIIKSNHFIVSRVKPTHRNLFLKPRQGIVLSWCKVQFYWTCSIHTVHKSSYTSIRKVSGHLANRQ